MYVSHKHLCHTIGESKFREKLCKLCVSPFCTHKIAKKNFLILCHYHNFVVSGCYSVVCCLAFIPLEMLRIQCIWTVIDSYFIVSECRMCVHVIFACSLKLHVERYSVCSVRHKNKKNRPVAARSLRSLTTRINND